VFVQFHERLLGQVLGIFFLAHQPIDIAVYGTLVGIEQFLERFQVPVLGGLNELFFPVAARLMGGGNGFFFCGQFEERFLGFQHWILSVLEVLTQVQLRFL